MNKQKLLYLSPRTGTLVVQPEGVICESGIPENGANSTNMTEYFLGDGGVIIYDEL